MAIYLNRKNFVANLFKMKVLSLDSFFNLKRFCIGIFTKNSNETQLSRNILSIKFHLLYFRIRHTISDLFQLGFTSYNCAEIQNTQKLPIEVLLVSARCFYKAVVGENIFKVRRFEMKISGKGEGPSGTNQVWVKPITIVYHKACYKLSFLSGKKPSASCFKQSRVW